MDFGSLLPWRRKAAAAAPSAGFVMFGLSPYSTAFPKGDLTALGREGYGKNTTVYACVNEIANAAAGIPWTLMRKAGRTSGRLEKVINLQTATKAWAMYQRTGDYRFRKAVETSKIEEHPLLTLLQRPNPRVKGTAMRRERAAWLLLTGNTYLKKVGPLTRKAPPTALYVMAAPFMRVVVGDRFNPVAEYVFAQGTPNEERHEALTVNHLKLFNPTDPVYGLSPIAAAALSVDTDNEAALWNLRLIQNSGRVPGAFVAAGNLAPDQKADLREQVKRKVAGAMNAGKPLVLDGGVSWQPFGISPADMDWLNSRRNAKVEVCVVYGVPPELIGDSTNKTYSNFQEARKAFYLETILPYMDVERDEYNDFLTPDYGEDLLLDYDRDQIEAIQEDRTAVFDRAERSTFLTIDERRAMVGLDDYTPGGEDEPGKHILVDSGKVYLEDLGEMAEGLGDPGDALDGAGQPGQAAGALGEAAGDNEDAADAGATGKPAGKPAAEGAED